MEINLPVPSPLSHGNMEKYLRKILPLFFLLILLTTVFGAISGYLQHNAWTIGDWLINYQGGMVRRGFLGEIIYQISDFTSLNPGVYATFFQIFFYSTFFLFSFLLLKKQESLLPYSLLIFSPFIFTFQIYDLQGGFRKEIIFFAVLSFIVFKSYCKDIDNFKKSCFTLLTFYPLLILTHEMFIIFLPYILIAFFSKRRLTNFSFISFYFLITLSLISIIICFYFQGNEEKAIKIYHSLAMKNYILHGGGAIASLDKSQFDPLKSVLYCIKNENYAYYSLTLIISLIAYIPIHKRLKIVLKDKFCLLMLILSLFLSTSLFVLAIDWGRFIYIHLVSLFLLSLINIGPVPKCDSFVNETKPKGVKFLTIAFFLTYTMSWHIPHFASPIDYAKRIDQINLLAFKRPYKEVFFLMNARSNPSR